MSNLPLMDNVVPQRAFLPIPAELRNMIYRYLVRDTYLIYWPLGKKTNTSSLDTDLPLPKALVSFPIFRVSRTTRQEALALLYAESTFRYWIDRTRQSYSYCDACPGDKILSLVQNIEIDISVPSLLSDVPSLVTVQTCKEITNKLNQSLAPRQSLMIRFSDCDAPLLNDDALLPLFKTLAKLTRFKTVVVEIYGGAHRPDADRDIPLARVRTMIQPGILAHMIAECDRVRENAREVMEGMLGRVMEEGEVESAMNVCYARYLRFSPLEVVRGPTSWVVAEKVAVADGGGGWDGGYEGVFERSVGCHRLGHTTERVKNA